MQVFGVKPYGIPAPWEFHRGVLFREVDKLKWGKSLWELGLVRRLLEQEQHAELMEALARL